MPLFKLEGENMAMIDMSDVRALVTMLELLQKQIDSLRKSVLGITHPQVEVDFQVSEVSEGHYVQAEREN